MKIVELQREEINVQKYRQLLTLETTGAITSFEGTVRIDDGILGLDYESYAPMAIKELHSIVDKVMKEFDLEGCIVVHRIGLVLVKECSILVICSAPHRKSTFQAVDNLMDMVKTSVPIWKKDVPKCILE
jgi:molybdopterin synthase catalytic subunit